MQVGIQMGIIALSNTFILQHGTAILSLDHYISAGVVEEYQNQQNN